MKDIEIILLVGVIVIIGALIGFYYHKSSGRGNTGSTGETFESSARFTGARPGFVFKKGSLGVGYYVDRGGDASR
jgi:hypothetical protein